MSDGVRGSWGGLLGWDVKFCSCERGVGWWRGGGETYGSLLEPSAPMLLSTNCCLSACDELFMSKESDDAWRLEGRKGLAVHGVRTKLVECLLCVQLS